MDRDLFLATLPLGIFDKDELEQGFASFFSNHRTSTNPDDDDDELPWCDKFHAMFHPGKPCREPTAIRVSPGKRYCMDEFKGDSTAKMLCEQEVSANGVPDERDYARFRTNMLKLAEKKMRAKGGEEYGEWLRTQNDTYADALEEDSEYIKEMGGVVRKGRHSE